MFFTMLAYSCYEINTADDKMTLNNPILKYLALGDSYTIGESVDPSMRWPVQLVDKLREDSVNMADAEIIAQTGWTTDELMNGIKNAQTGNDYDLVSQLIGVNNQYRERDITRQASSDPSLVASDDLHPSGKMYALWVDRVYSHVYQLLK